MGIFGTYQITRARLKDEPVAAKNAAAYSPKFVVTSPPNIERKGRTPINTSARSQSVGGVVFAIGSATSL